MVAAKAAAQVAEHRVAAMGAHLSVMMMARLTVALAVGHRAAVDRRAISTTRSHSNKKAGAKARFFIYNTAKVINNPIVVNHILPFFRSKSAAADKVRP